MDNLRAAIIFTVILLHVSVCYMAYAPSWWYVINPVTSAFFTYVVILVDIPIMPAMFFIAGYFALPSLQRQGTPQFLASKTRRLFVPWALGVLLLAPPTAYMIYFSRSVPMDLMTFWSTEFWGKMFQQSIYWFLGILFWAFVAFAAICKLAPVLKQARQELKKPSILLYSAIVIFTALGFYFAIQYYPVDHWRVGYLFTFQPERLPLLIIYFAFGVWAWKCGWFTKGGYMPRKRTWLSLMMVTGAACLIMKLGYGAPAGELSGRKDLLAPALTIFCLCGVMGLLALFNSVANRRGRLWASAADNSYGIYYVHALLVYWTAYFLIGLDASIYVKAALAFVLASVVSWLLSAGVLRKAPMLRRMF